LIASLAYVGVGIGTAALSAAASEPRGVKAWRVAAWVLSLGVFGLHVVFERRQTVSRSRAALDVALAVALGAFGVAALGPVRSHWGDPHLIRVAILSLAAWPLLTGVPAFCAALLVNFGIDHLSGHTSEVT
jgi:hypothetical protein